jgi:hypothetical protein
MNYRIIYLNEIGGVGMLTPCDPSFTVDFIAKKDVPTGRPYLIVEATDLPSDFLFFDAWEADFTNPDGYGEDFGVGSTNAVIGYNEDGSPVLAKVAVDENGVEYIVYDQEEGAA